VLSFIKIQPELFETDRNQNNITPLLQTNYSSEGKFNTMWYTMYTWNLATSGQ